MKRAGKILFLLVCASICTGGAILSVKENAREDRTKTNVVPIDNREPRERLWIWA
ncbi:MAG: hypothetical protein ABR514_05335 [Chthoniobacterales bacterium]